MPDISGLLQGYRRFHSKHFHEDAPLYKELARGQSPQTLIIGCSDSRVDPAIITGAEPGDIFAVRNVANIVPPFEMTSGHHGTSAAVEFAVRNIQVKDLIVLGHSGCAGIHALLHRTAKPEEGFLYPWMQIAEAARAATLEKFGDVHHPEARRFCEQQSILVSLENLRTFPWVSEREEAGALRLHGWYFRVDTGELSIWNPRSGSFRTVPIE